jgi:PIN domain nuclease of toxin-antitoxin system
MRLLLDTHIYLWWLTDDHRLTKRACSLIQEAEKVYVSSASIWEAAIKIHLGKLTAELDSLSKGILEEGFTELPVSVKHATLTEQLPHYHRDPFDRILIAQAISEPARFLTADFTLKKYSELIEIV